MMPALPPGHRSRSQTFVTATAPAQTIAGLGRALALLAVLLALVGTVVLTSWHDADPHVHGIGGTEISTLAADDHHQDSQQGEGVPVSDPLHMAAHSVMQGAAIPVAPVVASLDLSAERGWHQRPYAVAGASPTSTILRPPRA